MTDPEDPPRLLASPDTPEGLRDALSRARDDLGSDAEVARLAAKLGPLLGPAGGLPGSAPAAATSSVAGKLALGALALIVAGGGAWLLSAQNTSAPSPAPARSAAPPSAAPVALPFAPPVLQVPSAPEAAPTVSVTKADPS